MIGTVTLNPAFDKAMVVPGFTIGGTNRGTVERIDLGGKAINVARAARQLGCEVEALGFLAKANGRAVADALALENIGNDFIYVPGEMRVNLKIRDPIAGTETEINEPGFKVTEELLAELEVRISTVCRRYSAMVFSGSLPPGAPGNGYARLIRIAHSAGVPAILDTAGAALKEGLAAGPELVKANRSEAEELLGFPIANAEALVRAGREFLGRGTRIIVISLGADGALGMSAAETWRAWAPPVEAASSVAAGDSMVAALAYAMVNGMPLYEAVRLSVAAGTATASMSGSSVAGIKLIHEFVPRVAMEEWEPARVH